MLDLPVAQGAGIVAQVGRRRKDAFAVQLPSGRVTTRSADNHPKDARARILLDGGQRNTLEGVHRLWGPSIIHLLVT